MPLSTVVSPFCSSSATFLSTVIARSSLPPKRNVSPSPFSTLSRRGIALLSFLSLSLSAPASAIEIGMCTRYSYIILCVIIAVFAKTLIPYIVAQQDRRIGLKTKKRRPPSTYWPLSMPPVKSFALPISRSVSFAAETDAAYTDEDLEKIQQLFISAARDCVPQDRNSFVTFQANTGVEVCTFRLIVKNAASLLGNKDPVKLKAEALLDNLIRSFTSVSGMASKTNIQLASDRKKIADAVSDTISDLDKFELGIRDCLET
uniref:Uncharacterized protein n=1 Tax=Glycine max TaxID=3847 RepID=I1JTA9_SOYBN